LVSILAASLAPRMQAIASLGMPEEEFPSGRELLLALKA
jgi:hypothetical protein